MKTCTVDGCTDRFLAKGMCRKHYLRLYRNGTVEPTELAIARELSAYERLLNKVEQYDECLLYTGRLTVKGYVHVRADDGLMRFGHRIVYEYFNGTIPEDLELDHICDRRHCLNIKHIKLTSHKENIQRAVAKYGSRWGYGRLNVEDRKAMATKANIARWNK